MNIRNLHFKFFLLVLLAFAFYATPLSARPLQSLQCFEADRSVGWNLNVAAEYNAAELKSTDQYLSGAAGNEKWKAVNDVDGDLYGFSISATPPVFGKRATVDFSYLTGDLSGSFNTREIAPAPEGPYYGKVKFDRDQWELGLDVFILNAVYARLEYSTFKMDGDWVYFDGSPNEPQKYEYDAYTLGAGFRQDIFSEIPNTVFEGDFGLVVDVFFGVPFVKYRHTEQLTGASVKTDAWGYEMSAELMGTYKVNLAADCRMFAFAGLGYGYKDVDDSDLDLTEQGFTGRLGIRIEF